MTTRDFLSPKTSGVGGYDLPVLPEWRESAACASADPEAMYPVKGSSPKQAKRVCLGCDVREPCLEDALLSNDRFGIWGGLSDKERQALKRERRAS